MNNHKRFANISISSMITTPASLLPRSLALSLSGLMLSAPLALAAAGSSDPWGDLINKTINFAVLVALLVWVTRKPLGNMLRGAASAAKERLEGARKESDKADAELAEQKRKIENMQAELERMVEAAKKDAEQEKELLVQEARTQAERIKEHIKLQMGQEFRKASSQLQRQIADEMVKLAEGMISKRMNDETSSKIVTTFIDQMEARR